MVEYHYKAKDINGKSVRGEIQAEDEEQAYEKLRESGLFALSLKPDLLYTGRRNMGTVQLADFAKQMSVMLNSGIPLLQAVSHLMQSKNNRKMVWVYRNLYRMLLQGYGLSQALEQQKKLFPPLFINMVRAGEESGQLADAMEELYHYYTKSTRLRKKIESALIYPVFLLMVMVVSLFVLFTAVLPEFFQLFNSMDELPVSTRFLMWLSLELKENGVLLLVLLAVPVMLIAYLFQKEGIRLWWSRLMIRFPPTGRMISSISTARFAHTLSVLYTQGISLVYGLKLTIEVMNHPFLEKQLKRVMEDLCEGIPLSTGILGVEGLDERLSAAIFIGEETGELHELLEQLADSFQIEAEEAAGKLTLLIEPVLIVFLALGVGFIMFSVMVPLLQYYETIG